MSVVRKVGYGSPPKEHQFKKGQSGNTKGRPKKKQRDFIAAACDILDEPVRTNAANREDRHMDTYEVGMMKIAHNALNGSAADLYKIIDQYLKFATDMQPVHFEPIPDLDEVHRQLWDWVTAQGYIRDENGRFYIPEDAEKNE